MNIIIHISRVLIKELLYILLVLIYCIYFCIEIFILYKDVIAQSFRLTLHSYQTGSVGQFLVNLNETAQQRGVTVPLLKNHVYLYQRFGESYVSKLLFSYIFVVYVVLHRIIGERLNVESLNVCFRSVVFLFFCLQRVFIQVLLLVSYFSQVLYSIN